MLKCPGCGEDNPPKFRLCGYCGTPLAAATALPPREVRKTVTIVFCDLKGSTALAETLDAEAMHEVKARYFAAMAAEITRHGGKIEKYIGDAIMAVFGLPRAHEDDALRAVRAARGMQSALASVNEELRGRYGIALANRTGINTGEVVATDDAGADQKLATGDAVNVAARLEQAAPENGVYLGETTWRLVRDAVEVEPVEPLELKGKAQRVAAYRLLAAEGLDGLVRRHDRPLVGRNAELAAIGALYDEVRRERATRLVTLVGDAGLGKSRLVREVIDRVAGGARVLAGRCLPYGDGITFWPLLGMLREAADIRDGDTPEQAVARLVEAVGDEAVAQRLASATGLSRSTFPLTDLYWAARKFFERWAADAPLVVFVDDIHWAEPAFLDLLEHVRATAAAPILMLATARHDLIEARPEWGTEPGSLRLELRALSDDAARQLVVQLLGDAQLRDEVMRRIVNAAEGNPLYAEQMLSMLIDNGALRREGGQWLPSAGEAEIVVPPTIQALLEARLDALARPERATVEPASVIGLEFPQSAVESLAPAPLQPDVPSHLGSLTRRQFVRPAASSGAELVYRFHHHLVRETVYNGLLKRARTQLHLAFVRWADRANADSDRALEFEEILGYHLEQAHRYLRELGPLDAEGHAVGSDAARRLASAGRRAADRGDRHAAANLLRRAIALLDPADPQRWPLLPELAETLIGMGDFDGARTMLAEASAAGERSADVRLLAASELLGQFLRVYSGEQPEGWGDEVLRQCAGLVPQLEAQSADNELATAWRLVAMVHGMAGRYGAANEAVVRSIAHAQSAGNGRVVARNRAAQAMNSLQGEMPVPEAIAQCRALLEAGLSDRQLEASVMCALAQLEAMDGALESARALYRRSRSMLRDLGQGVYAASTGIDLARVELLGGDLELARREVEADCAFLATRGETYFLSTMTALLAQIARAQGRDDDAMRLSEQAEAATAEDDMESQALWRMVRAPLLARRGDIDGAMSLARGALERVQRSESPVLQADALAELAEVQALAGDPVAARRTLAEAMSLYRRKGHRVAAERTGRRAASLGGA